MSHDFVANIVVPNVADVLAVEFSTDSRVLCAATSENTILQFFADRLYKPSTITLNSTMSAGEDLQAPAVCMRFQPESHHHYGEHGTAKNLVLAASVDGGLSQWHIASGRRLQSARFPENPVYAIDYSPTSDTIAVGCDDGHVHILDPSRIATVMEKLVHEKEVDWLPRGALRVQSVKHLDPNIILSGGWGRTINVWDRRVGRSVSRISGPYLCGDGLDVHGTTMVTASFQEEDPLQLWDLRNLMEPTVRSLIVPPVPPAAKPKQEASLLATASFSKGSYHHHPNSPSKTNNVADAANDAEETILKPSLFTAKFSPNGTRLLVGGNFGQLHYYDVVSGEEIIAPDSRMSKGIASASLITQAHSIFSIAWSPDGRNVGLGGGNGLCLGVMV